MLTESLDYTLPPNRIATKPAEPRDAARLMLIDRRTGQVAHHRVSDLPELMNAPPQPIAVPRRGDLLVLNRSRVLAASFHARRAATGGQVHGLYLTSPSSSHGCHWLVMLESRGKLCAGEQIDLAPDAKLRLIENRHDGQWLAELLSPHDTTTLLNRIGHPPLPPYIRRQRRHRGETELHPLDRDRYNTVYAVEPGSVAAPTAGLHFTSDLLAQLQRAGVQHASVTLHVGLGTFAPVRSIRIEDHAIHREQMTVPAATLAAIAATHRHGGRVIPVGTTTVRALESLPDPLPEIGDFTTCTELLITPADASNNGSAPSSEFLFRFTDCLLTNFHLPRSTLMAMVAALPGVGVERLKRWYQLAVDEGYRFYSYGDAMLIV